MLRVPHGAALLAKGSTRACLGSSGRRGPDPGGRRSRDRSGGRRRATRCRAGRTSATPGPPPARPPTPSPGSAPSSPWPTSASSRPRSPRPRRREAYNGARWRAARPGRPPGRRAGTRAAARDVRLQRPAYGDALVSTYQLAPELSTLAAIIEADGISAVVDRTTSLRNAESALDANYDSFRASATLAEVATGQAEQAEAAAVAAAAEGEQAKAAAQAAADAAAADAAAIAAEKDALIGRLAHLQDISVDLARDRQSALEAEAAAAAAAAAGSAREAAHRARRGPGALPGAEPAAGAPGRPDAHARPHAEPHARPGARPHAQPRARPQLPAPPAPAAGAAAAIAFARAQLGEPYRWGAAGPDAWDCSGLTMGAWAAGGKYAAALLRRAVRAVDPDLRERPAARRPGLLGLHERARRRSTTSRSTSGTARSCTPRAPAGRSPRSRCTTGSRRPSTPAPDAAGGGPDHRLDPGPAG